MNMKILTLSEMDTIIGKLPVVSDASKKVVELCNKNDPDLKLLADIISTDSALTAMILRVSNSAFYGMPHTIHNPLDAVTVLGSSTIGSIAAMAMLKQIASIGESFKRFNLTLFFEHCLKAACIGRLIAHGYNIGPSKGFTIGLLHDIGGLILAISGKDNYAEDMVSGVPCHFDHAPAGAYLANKWNFPMDIESAIATHHLTECGDLAHLADDSCKLSMSIGLVVNNDITISNPFFTQTELKLIIAKASDQFNMLKGLISNG